MPSIWNKYKKIKELKSNSNIKTYMARMEPIVKEIIPKKQDDFLIIIEKLELLKEEYHIYEIIEDNEKIYVILENNEKKLSNFDNFILSNDLLDIKKEGIIQGHGRPITKEEILKLFDIEKSMCKITFETLEGNTGKGSGFFCDLEGKDLPFKYALFTNNHVLNESNIEIGNSFDFEYNSSDKIIKKEIKITENRKVFTNKELDYTCIELFESDGILDYFKIEPNLFKSDKNFLKNNDIFILQFPKGNDLSFSYGKILSLKGGKILHSASTESGSSGSPIIRRSKNYYIIGFHSGTLNEFNIATRFDLIINNIKVK